jgi:TfoX/Sxy family transcriptional regulator of competence genes
MSRSLELLTEACTSLTVTTRRMFGGHGFFAPNGGMFAGIVTDDAIIFKLQLGPLRDQLIGLGGKPWVYNQKMTMKEWIVVPESFYDDSESLAEWASKAHRVAPAKTLNISAKKAQPAKKASAPKRKSRR